jgi:hypothetical protein
MAGHAIQIAEKHNLQADWCDQAQPSSSSSAQLSLLSQGAISG